MGDASSACSSPVAVTYGYWPLADGGSVWEPDLRGRPQPRRARGGDRIARRLDVRVAEQAREGGDVGSGVEQLAGNGASQVMVFDGIEPELSRATLQCVDDGLYRHALVARLVLTPGVLFSWGNSAPGCGLRAAAQSRSASSAVDDDPEAASPARL